MTENGANDEYLSVDTNVRHFQTIRFAQLTVFIAILGGLLSLLFTFASGLPTWLSLSLKVGGLAITILFWILQERTMVYWNHFVRLAAQLEKGLGYRQYSTRPRQGFVSGTNAIRGFFLVVCLFWVAAMIWSPL